MNTSTISTLLSGQHAVVTGGARGIGRAVAAALLRHGAAITLAGRDGTALQTTAAELGAGVGTQVMDVSDGAAVHAVFDRIREQRGEISILINNAGQAQSAPLHRTDAALWQRMIDVNLTGTFHCIHAALPGMLATGHGRIVNIASIAGQVGYAYVAAYCAAKHGVIGLTRSLARELAGKHITVNAVCPGYTDTDMVRRAIATIQSETGRTVDEAMASLLKHNPQRRLIQPEEVASAVLWLCLPGSESVTGQSLSIAGGEVM